MERVVVGTNGVVTIYLDRKGAPAPQVSDGVISKVLVGRSGKPYFTQRNESDVLQQVIDTYKAIRDALNGLDPANPDPAFQREIVYRGKFTRFTDIWGRGDGVFTHPQVPLDQTPSDMPNWFQPNDPDYSGNNLPAFISDRRLRQAGFSTSTSRDHLYRIEADRFGIPTIYDPQSDRPLSDRGLNRRPDPTPNRAGVIDALPILWTEDNDDPGRHFFENRQLIFSPPNLGTDPNGPFEVFVGKRFYTGLGFEEGGDGLPRLGFAWDGFDDWRQIAASGVTQQLTRITDPFGTDRITDQLGWPENPQWDYVLRPESGTPREEPIALRQWQLIVRNFAEWTTDFGSQSLNNVPNVAVIGLMDMLTKRQGIFNSQSTILPGSD
ncbi:MAG TPA: hypothetical protein EYP14_04135, partial [Planctomycetaceae bacterium]|nr:hypothetical protein [Planctomycetaceae bacterium]